MTSRTQNGSRSAAANDVSSCVFVLPRSFTALYLRSYLLICLCHHTTHHIHLACLPSVHRFRVIKKEPSVFMVGPYLTSILPIMLGPSVTRIINMGCLIFDCQSFLV